MVELVWFNQNGEPQKSFVSVSLGSPQLSPMAHPAAPFLPLGTHLPESLPERKCGTNVYISRLPKAVTQVQLEKLFQGFGTIMSCRVVYHTQGKQGRVPRDPVGFVQFLQPEVAQAAIAGVNGMLFEGKRLVVRLADQDKDKGITSQPSDNLYVANLPKHFTEVDLTAIFSPYGQIEMLVVLKHLATGQSKGSGMVRFAAIEDAIRCRDALNCSTLPGLDYPLEVKFAESKTDKQQRQWQKLSFAQRATTHATPRQGSPGATPAGSPQLAPFSLPPPSSPSSPLPLFSLATSSAAPPPAQSQAAVMSALEEYLRTMLPHRSVPKASHWQPKGENSLESDASWENTYGYSDSSDSDGFPMSPQAKPRPPARPAAIPAAAIAATAAAGAARPVVPPYATPPGHPEDLCLESLTLSGMPSGAVLRASSKVCIANLPPKFTQLALYQLCAHFGAILSCTLQMDEDRSTMAWLTFKKAEEAAQAELKLDGQVVQGYKLKVELW